MPNILKTRGIILKVRQFKESSIYCSVFTRDYGKLSLLAKGVRRPKSRLCGTLEPLNHSEIIFYKREFKETYTLSDASIVEDFDEIRSSHIKFAACEVMGEFIEKTQPPETKDTAIYEFMLFFIRNIGKCEEISIGLYTLVCLFKGLRFAGLEPYLKDCIKCHRSGLNNNFLYFSISAGGVVCEDHFDTTAIKLHRKTVELIKEPTALVRDEINNPEITREMKRLLEDYINYHINGIKLNALKYVFT